MPAGNRDRHCRGSLQLALQIARSPAMLRQACEAFDSLVYAPGSTAAKNALFLTWKKTSESRGDQALPLTVQAIRNNVAVRRSAGYRAVKSFLFEAKDRHGREGHAQESGGQGQRPGIQI